MKPKINPFLRYSLAALLTLFAPTANASNSGNYDWDGDTNSNFTEGGNWVGGSWDQWSDYTFGEAATSGAITINGEFGMNSLTLQSDLEHDIVIGTTGNPLIMGINVSGGNPSALISIDTASKNLTINSNYIASTAVTWDVGANRTLTLNGQLNNWFQPAALVKNGAGTAVLAGGGNYSGTTTINAGTLLATNNTSLGAGGHNGSTMTFINDGATLALQGGISLDEHFHIYGSGVGGLGALRSISGNNALTNTNGGAAGYSIRSNTTVGVDAGTLSVAGFYEETGSFSLTKAGAGTLALTVASTYTGGTTVNGGTLSLASSGALPSSGGVAIGAGGKLSNDAPAGNSFALNGLTLTGGELAATSSPSGSLGNFYLNGDVTVAGSALSTISADLRVVSGQTRDFNVGSTGDLSGVDLLISGKLGHQNGVAWGYATKSGAGTMKLSGGNEIGGMTVNAGRLILEDNAIGWTFDSTGLTNNSQLEFSVTSSTRSYTAGIGGSGALFKTGAGTLTLTAANSYTGGTTITGGTLQVGNGGSTGSLGSGAIVNNGALVYNIVGGSVNVNQTITGTGTLSMTGDQSVNFADGTSITTSGSQTYSATATGTRYHGFNLADNATVTLTSTAGHISMTGMLGTANGNTGNLVINTSAGNGSVTLNTPAGVPGVDYGLNAVTVTAGTGTINLGTHNAQDWYNVTTLSLTGGVINSTANMVQFGTLTVNNSGAGTFSGNLTASGGALVKEGAGPLTLSGANTYTGGTTINAGTLQIGDGGTTGSLSTSSVITNNGNLTINRSDAVTQGTHFSGSAITGSGSFTQAGAGTTTLTAANTYTGTTTVSAGKISLASSGSLPTAGQVSIAASGILSNDASAGTSFNLGALTLTGGELAATSSPDTSLGNYHLSGDVTVSGSTRSTISADLRVISGQTRDFNVGSTGDSSGVDLLISGKLGHQNNVAWGYATKSGAGTMKQSGINQLGAMTINAGRLILQDTAADWGYESGGLTNNAELEYSVTSGSRGNNASHGGSGNLYKTGVGTLTLSGGLNYSGTTTVAGGTLNLQGGGVGGTDYNGSNININGASTLRVSGQRYNFAGETFTFNGVGGGTIDAIASGAGGMVFMGGNTFVTSGGAQNIISGTRSANEGFNLNGQTATFNVATGTDATSDLKVTGTLWNGGNVVKDGAGRMEISSTQDYSGTTSVTAGKLIVNGSIASSSMTTVQTGATLGGSGPVGALTVQSGGTHNAGNSPGLQTVASATYESGSIFAWDLAGNTTTQGAGTEESPYVFDQVTVTGALDVQSGAVFRVIQNAGLLFTDNFWDTNQEWSNIFSSGSLTNGWASNTAVGVYNTSNVLQDVSTYGSFTITGTTLTWTAVPEPTSALAGLLIAAGLLRRRR